MGVRAARSSGEHVRIGDFQTAGGPSFERKNVQQVETMLGEIQRACGLARCGGKRVVCSPPCLLEFSLGEVLDGFVALYCPVFS